MIEFRTDPCGHLKYSYFGTINVPNLDFQNDASGEEISDDSSIHEDIVIQSKNFTIGSLRNDSLGELALPDIEEDIVVEVIEPVKQSLEELTYSFMDNDIEVSLAFLFVAFSPFVIVLCRGIVETIISWALYYPDTW